MQVRLGGCADTARGAGGLRRGPQAVGLPQHPRVQRQHHGLELSQTYPAGLFESGELRPIVEVAAQLAGLIQSGAQVRRVLSYQQVPTILEDLWLPGTPFKGLTAERLSQYHGPMYALFESEFGVRMVRADEKIRALTPDDAQAALLDVVPGTPLLSVERIAYTYNDVPMELRRGLYRTDTHHYRNQLS